MPYQKWLFCEFLWGHSTLNGAQFLKVGHDPSRNLITNFSKFLQYLTLKSLENFSLTFCVHKEKWLFNVNKVTLKVPNLGIKLNIYDIWSFIFLELLILGDNTSKVGNPLSIFEKGKFNILK